MSLEDGRSPAVKYSKQIPGVTVRDAVLELISEPFVTDFAAEIPVTLTGSEVVEEKPDTWKHVMTCKFETSHYDLSSAIKKILPSVVHLTWQQIWTVQGDTEASADLHITTETKPAAKTRGTAQLQLNAGGLLYSFTGKTKVSVPVLGGSLGSQVDDHLVAGILDDQLTVLARRLQARPESGPVG